MRSPRHLTAKLIGAVAVVAVVLLVRAIVSPSAGSSPGLALAPLGLESRGGPPPGEVGTPVISEVREQARPAASETNGQSELLFVEWPSGAPLSSDHTWRMWLTTEGGAGVTEVESDSEGRLLLGPDVVGEWTIQSTSPLLALLDETIRIEPGSSHLIRVEPVASLRTRVVSTSGHGISGAEVEYLHSDSPPDEYLSLSRAAQVETTNASGYTPMRRVRHIHALRLRVCARGFFPATVRPDVRSDQRLLEEPQEILVTLTPIGPAGVEVIWQASQSEPWSLAALFDQAIPGTPSQVRMGATTSGGGLEVPGRWRTSGTRWILSTPQYDIDIPDNSLAGPTAGRVVLSAPDTAQFVISVPEHAHLPFEWSVFAELQLEGSEGPSILSLIEVPVQRVDSVGRTEFTCELPLSGLTTIRAYDSSGVLCSWTGRTEIQQERIELACQDFESSTLVLNSPVPLKREALASKDFRQRSVTLAPTAVAGEFSTTLVRGTSALVVEDADGLKYLIRLKDFGKDDSIEVILPTPIKQKVTLLLSDATGRALPGLEFVLSVLTSGTQDSAFASHVVGGGDVSVQVVNRIPLCSDSDGSVVANLPIGAYAVAVNEVSDADWGTADLKVLAPTNARFRLSEGIGQVQLVIEALRRVTIHVPMRDRPLDQAVPPQWALKGKYGLFSTFFYGELGVFHMGSGARVFFLEAQDGQVSRDLFIPQSYGDIEVEVQW